jgi:hypothetical protein
VLGGQRHLNAANLTLQLCRMWPHQILAIFATGAPCESPPHETLERVK